MITPLEYGLALAAVIAILCFLACFQDSEHEDGCGCCFAVLVILAAIIYLVYFSVRLVLSL